MTLAGFAIRWVHLIACLSLVGTAVAVLLAGRTDRHTASAWHARMLRWTVALLAAALVSGVAHLAHQAANASGDAGALARPAAWVQLAIASQFGAVWMARHGLLLLLAAVLLLRGRVRSTADWIAWRAEWLLLAAVGAGGLAWAGHAAAVEPGTAVAVAVDLAHVAAAALWLGALLPLAALLRAAATEAGADSRPFAVLAIRRFSAFALPVVGAVVVSGAWSTWTQVNDIAGLVGTRYGALVLAKVALLAAALVLAAVNRARWLPALSGDGATVGRPAMAALSRAVAVEWLIGLAILAVVSVLAATPPGRHATPTWPWSFRLDWAATRALPGVSVRLLIGSQLALVGLLALGAAVAVRRGRAFALSAGIVAVVLGAYTALPPLAVDAYPTTYVRSTVPYQAASVAAGLELYRAHCALCHGGHGEGDGPAAGALPTRPADLTAPHTGQHTAGDLYWWIGHGIPAKGMPPFADALDPDQRWDLINFVRALAAAEEARKLSPLVEPDRARLVAPDFSYAVGPGPARSLRELRGRRALLLVLFSLPGSRPRLERLQSAYETFQALGADVLAVPVDGGERIITRLGPTPPLTLPVATEGAEDIARAYALFAQTLSPARGELGTPARHMELLIDRHGYLRARWIPAAPGRGWDDPAVIGGELQQLAREVPPPPAAEHVH